MSNNCSSGQDREQQGGNPRRFTNEEGQQVTSSQQESARNSLQNLVGRSDSPRITSLVSILDEALALAESLTQEQSNALNAADQQTNAEDHKDNAEDNANDNAEKQ